MVGARTQEKTPYPAKLGKVTCRTARGSQRIDDAAAGNHLDPEQSADGAGDGRLPTVADSVVAELP